MKVLNISEAATLAFHAMLFLSTHPERLVSTREVAHALRGSEAHLSKVFQRLARAGLVRSIRGPNGGFRLGKKPDQITLAEIFEAIEGRLGNASCLLQEPICGQGNCIFGGMLDSIGRQVREYLTRTRLSEFSHLHLGEGGKNNGKANGENAEDH